MGKDFLDNLYTDHPELRDHDARLRQIIDFLITQKPTTPLTEDFIHTCKTNLLAHIDMKKNATGRRAHWMQNTSAGRNNFTSSLRLRWLTAGASVAVAGLIGIFLVANPTRRNGVITKKTIQTEETQSLTSNYSVYETFGSLPMDTNSDVASGPTIISPVMMKTMATTSFTTSTKNNTAQQQQERATRANTIPRNLEMQDTIHTIEQTAQDDQIEETTATALQLDASASSTETTSIDQTISADQPANPITREPANQVSYGSIAATDSLEGSATATTNYEPPVTGNIAILQPGNAATMQLSNYVTMQLFKDNTKLSATTTCTDQRMLGLALADPAPPTRPTTCERTITAPGFTTETKVTTCTTLTKQTYVSLPCDMTTTYTISLRVDSEIKVKKTLTAEKE